ncbi:hypothetical protein ACW9TO_47870, partial [Streptomyces sp. ATMOS53]
MRLKGRWVFPTSGGRSGRRRGSESVRRTALAVAAVLAAETALLSLGTGSAFAAGFDSGATARAAKAGAGRAHSAKAAASSADSVEAALLMARLQGRKIEVTGARTADSSTFALPSG